MVDGLDKDYHRDSGRVRALRGFYAHVLVYIVVNMALLVVNLIAAPNTLWFYWVAVPWGIGLFFHALDAYTVRLPDLERSRRGCPDEVAERRRRRAG